MDFQPTLTFDDLIAQLTATLDELIVKHGVLIQSIDQGQKLPVQPYTTDQRTPVSIPPLPTQPHKSSTLPIPLRNDIKDKNAEIDNKNKSLKKKIFKIDPHC